MTRLVSSAALLALLLGACSDEKGRALLLVDIEPAMNLPGVATAHLIVTQGNSEVGSKQVAWERPAEKLKIGVYVPIDIEGAVMVEASLLDVTGAIIAVTETLPTVIKRGQATELLTLHPMPRPPAGGDGGVPDAAPPADGAANPDVAATPDVPGGGSDVPGPGTDGVVARDGGVDVSAALSWKPTENLENDMVTRSYSPAVAIDSQGNALVTWTERTVIKTRRYDAAAKAWGAIVSIDSKYADYLSLVMAPNGHATLVWDESINQVAMADAGLWASHSKDGGKTWSLAKQVHAGPSYVYLPIALATSRTGDARVAWEESMNNMRTLWSARYDAATGTWSDIAPVKQGEDTNYRYQKLAMDNAGNGLLIWQQRDQMLNDSTWATSFLAGQPLKAPQLLDTLIGDDTDDPTVAIMASGNRGIAVWGQETAQNGTDLTYSDWTPATGFGPPAKILSVVSWTAAHAAVIDHNGTVTLAWTQPIASGKSNAVAARRLADKPWGAVELLESSNQSPPNIDQYPYPQLGVDAVGTVHVAWVRRMDAMDISTFGAFTRRWQNDMWQPEITIGLKAKLRTSDPLLAVGENGRAVIAFDYWDAAGSGDKDAYNIFAALFQ